MTYLKGRNEFKRNFKQLQKKTGGYFVLGLKCPTLGNKNIGAPKMIQNFGL